MDRDSSTLISPAIKDFPLPFREGMNVQFRAEFFNLFNHPHFFMGGTAR